MKGLIDSTLREGSQTFGLAFTLEQKKEIFAGLCVIGIEEVEVGIASSLDEDLPALMEFCRTSGKVKRLALWCRCNEEDILYARTLQPDVLVFRHNDIPCKYVSTIQKPDMRMKSIV